MRDHKNPTNKPWSPKNQSDNITPKKEHPPPIKTYIRFVQAWGPYTLAYLWLSLLSLSLLASMPLLPLIDLPQHVAQAIIWANPEFYPNYRLNPFTPYLTNILIMGTLSKWVDPTLAYKILLAAPILLLPLCLKQLFQNLSPECPARPQQPQPSDWIALTGFPLSFGFAFHMGFINYCLAVPLSLWILALITKDRLLPSIPLKKSLALTGLLTLLFFTHPIAFSLTVLLYPIFAKKWAPSKYLPLLAPTFLLGLWLLLQPLKANDAISFSLQGGFLKTQPIHLSLIERITHLVPWLQGSTWKVLPQGNPISLLALFLACALFAFPRKKTEPQKKPIPLLKTINPALIGFLLITLTYLFVPQRTFNIVYVGERLPTYIAALALCFLASLTPHTQTAPWKVWVLLGTLTLNLLHLTPLHPKIQSLRKESIALKKVLSHIPQHSHILAIPTFNNEKKTKPFFYWIGWIATQKANTRFDFTLASHLPIQKSTGRTPKPTLILTNHKEIKNPRPPIAQEESFRLLIPPKVPQENPKKQPQPHTMTLLFSYSCETPAPLEAGCDEVGRGALAGPVVAAAVILKHPIPGLNDSKKLSPKKRTRLAEIIKKEALTYAIASASVKEIDTHNILEATLLAMHRCLKELSPQPEALLIDGTEFLPYRTLPHHCIPQGDSKYQSIAAASILAKTHRDELMKNLHNKFPQYHWNQNKGYPTANHLQALQTYGPSPLHRTSFKVPQKITPKTKDDGKPNP